MPWLWSEVLPTAELSENESAVLVAMIGGLITLLVAVVGALTAYWSSKREQRRMTYSEAIRAATAWKELLYRVRRRQQDNTAAIVELFHEAQDELTFYEAWVGSESKYMARSYRRLIAAVKHETEGAIKSAWEQEIRTPPGNAVEEDSHPQIEAAVDRFLTDVRSHLSPWPWRKLAMACRNRENA